MNNTTIFVLPNDIADFEAHIAPLIQARWPEEREGFERFLRANPGMTVRDWKGKGPSLPLDPQPWEKPWHKLKPDEVATEAVRCFARELPHNLRLAAARHPDLVWNDYARKYRLRLPGDLPDGRGYQKRLAYGLSDQRRPRIQTQTRKSDTP